MKQATHSKAKRRAILGAITTAGVVGAAKLPGQWTRPVVDHVLLPAHAATTDDTGASGTGVSTFITTVTSNCVVSCTSAVALFSAQSSAISGSSISQYFYSLYNSYIQCSDPFGGFTTSAAAFSSYSTVYSTTNAVSSFYCNSSSFTSNAICNVTITSS